MNAHLIDPVEQKEAECLVVFLPIRDALAKLSHELPRDRYVRLSIVVRPEVRALLVEWVIAIDTEQRERRCVGDWVSSVDPDQVPFVRWKRIWDRKEVRRQRTIRSSPMQFRFLPVVEDVAQTEPWKIIQTESASPFFGDTDWTPLPKTPEEHAEFDRKVEIVRRVLVNQES